jgi:ribosomal protein S18 acetylase RimI-like enzyme
MPLAFAAMSIADYDEVIAFWRGQKGIGLNESDSREQIAQFLARNPGMSLVVRNGRQLVGAVLAGHDGRRGYLYHLAVNPAYRQQGLGRQIVARCLREFHRLGLHKCNINVFGNNGSGQAFWKRIGFAGRQDLLPMQKLIASTDSRC